MNAKMNKDQQQERKAVAYRHQMTVLHQAAVGVVLTRTREPFRVIDTLREFAFAEELEFRSWSLLYGWASYTRSDPTRAPTFDGTMDPFTALRKINAIDAGGQTGEGFPAGIYTMFYPHYNLPKHAGMIQCIKEYCRLFAEGKKRLVLVTPPGFQLPQELEDDVVILDFDPPSYAELIDIYGRILNAIPEPRRPSYKDNERDRILAAGAGMTSHEFENALSRALVTHRAKLPDIPIEDLANEVMKVKTEVVKRTDILEVMPVESMSNVGGLDNLKDWLGKRAMCFEQRAKDYGIEPPKGIALIGPPGTGKSLSAKATASVLGLPLIRFDISRVFQSLVGQSEQRIREALKMVDAMAPCVLLIDEVDKALGGTHQSSGDSGVGKRVLGTLLTWMQESTAPVFCVVSANRVDALPSEFLRRGRLDEVFSVSVPGEEERLEVLKIHLKKRGHDPDKVKNLDRAVEGSLGYVPAEIEAAVKDALIESFTASAPVTGELIADQLSNMVPLSKAFEEDFNMMTRWATNNARPANRTGASSSKPGKVRSRNAPSAGPSGRAMSLDG